MTAPHHAASLTSLWIERDQARTSLRAARHVYIGSKAAVNRVNRKLRAALDRASAEQSDTQPDPAGDDESLGRDVVALRAAQSAALSRNARHRAEFRLARRVYDHANYRWKHSRRHQ